MEKYFYPDDGSSRIYPNWNQIKNIANPLTNGEMVLAKYLDDNLPSEWEIFVQPFLNGDRPDIAILHKDRGITFFEVKDWAEELYRSKME